VSALADALVAAQRRALAAVEKQYAAGKLEADDVRAKLTAIGLTDDVDADRLLAALDLIREYGATLPAEPTTSGPDPGSFGGHPYTPDEIALGYGTDNDPRFSDAAFGGSESLGEARCACGRDAKNCVWPVCPIPPEKPPNLALAVFKDNARRLVRWSLS
jgi:hypothetical protein